MLVTAGIRALGDGVRAAHAHSPHRDDLGRTHRALPAVRHAHAPVARHALVVVGDGVCAAAAGCVREGRRGLPWVIQRVAKSVAQRCVTEVVGDRMLLRDALGRAEM